MHRKMELTMVRTIRLPPAEEVAGRDTGSRTSVAEAIRKIARAAAAVEKRDGLWEQRFVFALSNGLRVPGTAVVQRGGDPLTALADSFGLAVASASILKPKCTDGLPSVCEKLVRLLVEDKQVAVDFSGTLPRNAQSEGIRLCESKSQLERMTECFGVEFRPAALSLACSHPDIESFFDMYLDDAAGAPFLAVRVSHEFMESVRARRPFALRYPVEESVPGVRQEEGERSAVVLKEIDASMLWRRLLEVASHSKNAHLVLENCARPASPLAQDEVTECISPLLGQAVPSECGQMIVELDISHFVDEKGHLKTRLLRTVLEHGLRLADNLIDVVRWPLASACRDAYAYRRVAMSMTGIGEAAVKMRLDVMQFASLERLHQVCTFVSESLYRYSVALAREREPFPGLGTKDLFALVPKRQLERELTAKIDAQGTRNSQILAMAPFAVIPRHCRKRDIRGYSNLLPLLKFSHTLGFRKPQSLAQMDPEDLELFLRLSWAYSQSPRSPGH